MKRIALFLALCLCLVAGRGWADTVNALVVGGGGGGGYTSAGLGGGGGASGEYAKWTLSVTPGIPMTVNVGAGGAGATGSNPGGAGFNGLVKITE